MFHHFKKQGVHPAGQGAITSEQLENLIRCVGIKNILTAQEWTERFEEGSLEANHWVLTFDDNLKCQYDIAWPVMKREGLTGFWFVYTSVYENSGDRFEIYRHYRTVRFYHVNDFYQIFYEACTHSKYATKLREELKHFDPDKFLLQCAPYSVEDKRFRYIRDEILNQEQFQEIMDQMIRSDPEYDEEEATQTLWMTRENLKDLREEGNIIGLHSHNHPMRMSKLPESEQVEEFKKNLELIEEITGERPRTMSHPCNNYSPTTIELLKKLGIELGFRANKVQETYSQYEWPREDHILLIKKFGL